jgi:hypothetical protein
MHITVHLFGTTTTAILLTTSISFAIDVQNNQIVIGKCININIVILTYKSKIDFIWLAFKKGLSNRVSPTIKVPLGEETLYITKRIAIAGEIDYFQGELNIDDITITCIGTNDAQSALVQLVNQLIYMIIVVIIANAYSVLIFNYNILPILFANRG